MTIEMRLNALQTGLTIDAYETHLTMLDRAADMEASFGNDEKAPNSSSRQQRCAGWSTACARPAPTTATQQCGCRW